MYSGGEPTLESIFPADPDVDEESLEVLIDKDGDLRRRSGEKQDLIENPFDRDEVIARALMYQDIHNAKVACDPLTGETIPPEEIAQFIEELAAQTTK